MHTNFDQLNSTSLSFSELTIIRVLAESGHESMVGGWIYIISRPEIFKLPMTIHRMFTR